MSLIVVIMFMVSSHCPSLRQRALFPAPLSAAPTNTTVKLYASILVITIDPYIIFCHHEQWQWSQRLRTKNGVPQGQRDNNNHCSCSRCITGLMLHLCMTACGQLMKQIGLAAGGVLLGSQCLMDLLMVPGLIVSIGQQNLGYVADGISSIPTRCPRKGPT